MHLLDCTESVAAGRSLDEGVVREARDTGTIGLAGMDVLVLPSGTAACKGESWGCWTEKEAGLGSRAGGEGPRVAWSPVKARVSFLVCGEDKEEPGAFDGVWGPLGSATGGEILLLREPILLGAVDVGDNCGAKNRAAGADSVLEGALEVGVELRDSAARESGGRGRLEALLASNECSSATPPRGRDLCIS
jgi:hypothetical protein